MKKLFFIALVVIGFTTTTQAQTCIDDYNYDSSSNNGELSIFPTIDGDLVEVFTDLLLNTIWINNFSKLHSYYGELYYDYSANGIDYYWAMLTKYAGTSGGYSGIDVILGFVAGDVVSYDICFNY